MKKYKSIELCSGAGGQAIGLESAGFEHILLVDNDYHACQTLLINRPTWNVQCCDLKKIDVSQYKDIDLLAGGVPCPPFSIAGKQLGEFDERNLFPDFLRITQECMPKAILIENVRGIMTSKFDFFREKIISEVKKLGYIGEWRLLNACDFGVSQLRPRAVFVAFKNDLYKNFIWPSKNGKTIKTVGEVLFSEMKKNNWKCAEEWKIKANDIAPTIVGGSKKHGGPDLGPTRARKAWALLGVDGMGIVEEPPKFDFRGNPRLTISMVSLLQGFPKKWKFFGKKTPAYRQIGNAFPPPVAKAIGLQIKKVLSENGV
mgnify:CR=1 FL=1